MQTSSKLYKMKEISIFYQYFGTIDAFIFMACFIDFFILKGKIKDNNTCSMLDFILLKTSDDVKMCKTKYLVHFIANRSSVSKVLEENSIIDPFHIYLLPFRDNNSLFKK